MVCVQALFFALFPSRASRALRSAPFLLCSSKICKKSYANLLTHPSAIGPLQDPVTWYRINYTGSQMTQWDFQNKGILTSPARLSFVLKVPLRHLRPSVFYHVTGSCKGPFKADPPSQCMPWKNCRAVPSHQLPHVLCGAGA